MAIINLTREEQEELVISIHLRIGFIETGTLLVRANDAIKMGKQSYIKPLTSEQRRLITQLEDLANKLY